MRLLLKCFGVREGVIGTEILQTGICFELKAEREVKKNSDQRMWE